MQGKFLAFLLVIAVVLTLVACTPAVPEDIPCDTCVDRDGDYLCDVCGTLMPFNPDLPGDDDDEETPGDEGGDNIGDSDPEEGEDPDDETDPDDEILENNPGTGDNNNGGGTGNGGITVNPDGSIDLPGDKFN